MGGVLIVTFLLCYVMCENQQGAGQFARVHDHLISSRDQSIFPCVFYVSFVNFTVLSRTTHQNFTVYIYTTV